MLSKLMEDEKAGREYVSLDDFAERAMARNDPALFFQLHKIAATIRLDNDVVMYFKKMSSETKQGYQTLMNNALRTYINTHEGGISSK